MRPMTSQFSNREFKIKHNILVAQMFDLKAATILAVEGS